MTTDTGRDAAATRDHFIPLRKTDLIEALAPISGDAAAFRRFAGRLAAILHYGYFDRLEALRNDYFYFNPDLPHDAPIDPATLAAAHDDLVATMTGVFQDADFVTVPREQIDAAHRGRHFIKVDIDIPMDLFREVRVFRRGHHRAQIEHRDWFGLRRREAEVDVFDHVVLMVTIQPASALDPHQIARLKRMRLRPGTILIKYFRDIAHADLAMLFPGVRVVMSLFDKLALGLPAIVGGIPIIFNLLPTISVLFLVIGFYLGFSGAIQDEHMRKALAALSGLAALGGFITRQWLKYQRQSLKYHKDISDNVYFRNINNNAGLFDAIVGTAEAEECKKVLLAYVFLARTSTTKDELEMAIEGWLRERIHVDISFDVADALKRLDELKVLRRDGARLSVASFSDASVELESAWMAMFAATEQSKPAIS